MGPNARSNRYVSDTLVLNLACPDTQSSSTRLTRITLSLINPQVGDSSMDPVTGALEDIPNVATISEPMDEAVTMTSSGTMTTVASVFVGAALVMAV